MPKRTLLFAPCAFNLAETSRMVEIAKAVARAPNTRVWRPIAAMAAFAWFFFAIGPGSLFGVDLFGAPNAGPLGWLFGIPSLWAWQIMGWAFGVLLLWLLAYRLAMSRPPPQPIELEAEDIRRSGR